MSGIEFRYPANFSVAYPEHDFNILGDVKRFAFEVRGSDERVSALAVAIEEPPLTPLDEWLFEGMKAYFKTRDCPVLVDSTYVSTANAVGVAFVMAYLLDGTSYTHFHWMIQVGQQLVNMFAVVESSGLESVLDDLLLFVESVKPSE
ncbi:hypothetical protein ABYF32_07525 [Buchananella felis]|uniref:hypothetical protein n=1 Tax=Buchananella felis TaxID=3231492 RepID=UPI003527CDD8